jgi:hypothetical protein
MRRVIVVVGCCLLLASAGVAAIGSQDGDFTVDIPGSIDTPERTVTVEGSTYTVSSIARVQQGDQLEVQTDGPDGEGYRVYIHAVDNGSRSVYDTKYVFEDQDGTVTFDTSEFETGSYVVSVYHEGTYYDPQPLVVPAYEVAVSAPDTVPDEGTQNISVSLTELVSGETVDSVEIVISNEDSTTRVTTTEENGTYVGEVSLDPLSPGTYQMHAVAYSPESTPGGANEVIGISDESSLTVEANQQATTTTDSSGGTGDSSTSSTTTTTSTTDTTSTSTPTPTPTSTTPETTANTQTTTTTPKSTTDTTSQATPTTQTSTTESSVITPGTDTTSTPDDTSNGEAGGVPLALLALLATIALLATRRQ